MQLIGFAQNRVLLTPYWSATPWTSAAGIEPSSSWFAFTSLNAVCSLRFHWTLRPLRLRGRSRPGPRFQ